MSDAPSDSGEQRPEEPEETVRKKKKYVPAVTPRLRIALMIVFGLFALLAANSIYLLGVTIMQAVDKQHVYQDFFYLSMFLLHLLLGVLILLPFIIFATYHLAATRKRKNRTAVRMGYMLLSVCIAMLVSGILLTRVSGFELKQPTTRQIVYLIHVITPLAAVWLYWLHRLAGPPIKWRVGLSYIAVVAVVVGGMFIFKLQDPRDWSTAGAPESEEYFAPSLVRTGDGRFIDEDVLMNDEYCMKCHADIYEDAQHSAHRFSSFNNPWYLTSVMETRRVASERDGSVKASRWCAGCHDPVPFFSGKFDDPNFDFVNDKTAGASITCTVCHAITNVNSNVGNADFTIEAPIHYPFAYSKNDALQWVNNQLVKAKPEFHKQMMLKPFHKSAEFCASCHKVHLPGELTQYKEWLRGQNHYDSYLLSGVSGHGIRSFYYPPVAQTNCNECHMPQKPSNDFGAFPSQKEGQAGQLVVHNHQFPSANTAIGWIKENEKINDAHRKFLDGVMRVDIFGLKQEATIDSPMTAPLRPVVPELVTGKEYLLETVIRTMKMGHHFTQGTVDSNEIWMDVKVIEGAQYDDDGNLIEGRIIGRSGGMDEKKQVDPWSHFVNVFMLDRKGNRVDRRNAEDIFVPLYNHQIPPGAGQVVHYKLKVPEKVSAPITVDVKLQYRKFDQRYSNIVAQFHRDRKLPFPYLDESGKERSGDDDSDNEYVNLLPITTLASDRITFPVKGIDRSVPDQKSEIEVWQRWNDYGIGLLLEGKASGMKGESKYAEQAFRQVEAMGQFHGPLNLARVYLEESFFNEAVDAMQRANAFDNQAGYPVWTAAWLNGEINFRQGHLEEAVESFRSALEYRSEDTIKRKFDFTKDYVVRNLLGLATFELSKTIRGDSRLNERIEMLKDAAAQFQKSLEIDSENAEAHYQLSLIFGQLAEAVEKLKGSEALNGEVLTDEEIAEFRELAERHNKLQFKYKVDESASAIANRNARAKYPWANKAADAVVLYSLNDADGFELPAAMRNEKTAKNQDKETESNE